MCSFLNMIAGAASGVYQGTIQNAQNNASYEVSTAQTDAANMLSQDQADNSNSIRDANNEFAAAQASLSNTQRSISNQNKAMAIGSQYNATLENQARTTEAMVRGNVEQQIASSAALGAMRVQAAAAGVGGTSADIMRSTMKGRNARLVTQQNTANNERSFDQMMSLSGMRSNLITSQDYGQTVANMNYAAAIPTTYIAPAKMPDLTYKQMELMGAAGGGGFQQFSQSKSNSSVGFSDNSNGSGTVGQTSSYSSQSILSGVDSTSSNWSSGSDSSGSNSYNFNLGDSSSSSGSSSNFNFSLS